MKKSLTKAGVKAEVHDDHFSSDAPDHTWLMEIGRKGWVLLTADKRIAYRELERRALFRAKVRSFVLVSGNMKGSEMAEVFVKALPRMQKLAARKRGPFIAKIYKDGRIRMWEDSASETLS